MLDKLKEKLSKKVTNLSNAIFVTEEQGNLRMEICKSCEKLSPHSFCRMCGCFMPAKTKLANESCPIGKWSAIENEKK